MFEEMVLERIELILHTPLDVLQSMSNKTLIEKNYMDPVRVFVKNEPHKKAKLDEGRVRLIMSVSVIDKVIEMFLCSFICKNEIANWTKIPSKPGLGFSDSDNKVIYDDIMTSGVPMTFADMQGWDWSVKEWMIKDAAEASILMVNNPSSVWMHLMRAKSILECDSIYQFSDGLMVSLDYKGVVDSGKFKTSRDNSFMRARVADLVGSYKIIAAGDDSVEQTSPHAQENYLKLGLVCKEYEPVTDGFEFCSHYYGPQGAFSLNKVKIVMNLLHHKDLTALEGRCLLAQFEADLNTHPDYPELILAIGKVGLFEEEEPQYIVPNNIVNQDE